MFSLPILSSLILLLIGLIFSRRLFHLDPMIYGLFFGCTYFMFYPLLYLLFTQKLSIPWWYKSIGLKDIDATNFSSELTILFFFILGIFIIFLLRTILRKEYTVRKTETVNNKEKQIFFWCVFLYFFFSVGILIFSGALNQGHWYSSRAALRESSIIALIVSYFIWGLRLIIVAYTFELLEKQQLTLTMVILIVISICMFDLIFVGNRISVLLFGIALVIYIVKNYGLLRLIISGFIIGPFALIMATYQNVRYLLFNSSISELFSELISQLTHTNISTTLLSVFEYGDTLVLLNVFKDVGSTIDLAMGSTFIRLLSWVIPRSIWLDKPLPVSIQLGNYYIPGVAPALLLFGEFFYNFSFIGIFIFPLLVYLFCFIYKKICSIIKYKTYLLFIIGFLMFRMSVADTFIYVVFATLTYIILSDLFLGKNQPKFR